MVNEKKNSPSNQVVIDNEKIVDILLHAATREEVKSVETSLREEIKQVETSLREEIKQVETSLREEIKQVETSLREEIKRVETKVDRLLYAIIVVGIIPILIRIFG